MNPRALSIGAASALVVAGLFVSVTASAAATTCQGQSVTIPATADQQQIEGTDGRDVISAVGFDDVIIDANGGDDIVCGGARSIIQGGPGADTFVGAAHHADRGRYSILTFPEATRGVDINLVAGTVYDGGEIDMVIGIRHVRGTQYNDAFTGTSADETYTSSSVDGVAVTDNDYIAMRGGDDTVFVATGGVRLGPGNDRASVGDRVVEGGPGNDEITLHTNGAVRGGPGDDVLSAVFDIEKYGPGSNNTLLLLGAAGRDVIRHPIGGSVVADGGAGRDTLELARRSAVVDLAAGWSRTRSGRAELSSVEDVEGGSRADVIRGNAGRNHLDGGRGDDILVGRGGNDLLHGDRGRDRAHGGAGHDRCGAEVRRSC